MLRRIYFAVPDVAHARRIAGELERVGIDRSQIHAAAKPGVDISNLPAATRAQHRDRVWSLDQLAWKADLIFFGLAGLILVLALVNAWLYAALTAVAVMVLLFLAGDRFAVRIPHGRLADLRVPLKHGEIVLMVDIRKDRLREIEQLVSRHHPEAGIGSVGWTFRTLET
jgi:hypothetical protein